MNPCPTCGSLKRGFNLKIIPTGKPLPYPKYIPQIKENCLDCMKYIRFSPQTPELVAAFNKKFEGVVLTS